jgi:hypothetical protein
MNDNFVGCNDLQLYWMNDNFVGCNDLDGWHFDAWMTSLG